ncbi:glycosyltransferase family 4 protein [Dietzia cercidiphylli]|uniref:glycosyltransferase family 4 protein n=1 Tax=Dietzia cercidiphylli TaxID=498199 RepID=UPI00223C4A47|nr:glycosyltransferase family 4 protein [Dietzia cercidiphylli]MCT1517170.1 glycosyltransferase family 4 protein [Dietzia cercidiphylli]
MRILMAWSTDGVGGNERRMVSAGKELSLRGHDVSHYITSQLPPSSLADLIVSVSGKEPFLGGCVGLLRHQVKLKPDVVIANGLTTSIPLRLSKLLGKQFILFSPRPGLDYNKSRTYFFLDSVARSRVDAYLTNSPAASLSLISRGIRPRQIVEIPSALEGEWFSEAVGERGKGSVLMVGNCRPEKNHLFGLKVYLKSSCATQLTVYTDDATELRRFDARRTEYERRVKPIHFVEGETVGTGVYDSYAVLIHPSISESLPRTVLEAQARGCGVIASDVGSTKDWVDDQYCLRPVESDEWAAALDKMLSANTANPSFQQYVPLSVEQYVDQFLGQIVKMLEARVRPDSLGPA